MRSTTAAFLLLSLCPPLLADEPAWVELKGLDPWKAPTGDWVVAGGAKVNPKNEKLLTPEPGEGVIVNGTLGRTRNLISKQTFGPVEVHAEFFIPKGSNAGIKLEEIYEIQIFDSYGKAKLGGDDCGGIYPRAQLLPTYHHLDDGYPPKLNACKPPGEWQTLDITFQPPKFRTDGKTKTANARFVKVLLNGQVVQEDVEMPLPTGHVPASMERPVGSIMLQADHGPVAFRNIKVRPIAADKASGS